MFLVSFSVLLEFLSLVNSTIFISTVIGKLPEVLPHVKVPPLTGSGRLRSQRCPAIFIFLQLVQPRCLSWKLFLICSTRLWLASVLDNSSNLQIMEINQTLEVSEICFLEEISLTLGQASQCCPATCTYIPTIDTLYTSWNLEVHLPFTYSTDLRK